MPNYFVKSVTLPMMRTALVTKKREAEEEPVQTKEEILADFAEACRELKLHREGKKELQTWDEFKKELQDEGYYN